MPSWEGKSKATPLGYRIFVTVLKTFGLRPAYGLLRVVALYYLIFSRSSTRHLLQYFQARLNKGKWPALGSAYRTYYQFGQSLIDKVAMQSGMDTPFTFDFDGEQYLREIVAGGKGGMLLSAHVGNWEIAGHLLKRLNTTINVVMYDGEQEQIKAYLEKVTGGRNMQLIIIREDLSHIYDISEALQKNQLVCMHADRFMEGNKTMTMNFLGAQAQFPAGPFVVATSFAVPVSFVFAFKETSRHYHFYATPPQALSATQKKDQVKELLDKFVREMETKTRKYPEQWFNFYDFWKA
jgi:predicted LPLAT superfamily acyltransferase